MRERSIQLIKKAILSVQLSVCLIVCLSISPSFQLSVCLFFSPFVHSSNCLPVYCLSVRPPARRFSHPSIILSACLSVRRPVQDSCNTSIHYVSNSRTSSPKLGRRSPGLGGQGGSSNPKSALLMRSLTVDMIPDFELPPERVQPRTAADQKGHQTALQFQQSIINSLSNDIQR